jgi:predicted sulfurtransferase
MAGKILLFYKYVDIQYPVQIVKWQKKICEDLGLKGRILIATEGINGTVGGSAVNCDRYKEIMSKHPLFGSIDFKESEGDENQFPRMRIAVRNEVVALGIDPSVLSAKDGGTHLTPAQAHELLTTAPEDLVILDGRNTYEAAIGTFRNAVVPPIENFRELPEYLEKNLEQFKDKQVFMFCTGGIRCERASALLKSKGVTKQVYQLEGGIHRYIEQFPDGHFRGKNYVFDGRIAVKANDDILGTCHICTTPNDEYTNCLNATCNLQFLACAPCITKLENCCSANCMELVRNKEVVVRTKPKKVESSLEPKNACSL